MFVSDNKIDLNFMSLVNKRTNSFYVAMHHSNEVNNSRDFNIQNDHIAIVIHTSQQRHVSFLLSGADGTRP